MLTAFKQFLNNKERIPERNIPYYLKWVADCYRFFNAQETDLLTNDQTSQFLTHLAKKHEDWQVEQADRALKLYGYFLSKTKKGEGDPGPNLFRSPEFADHHDLHTRCHKERPRCEKSFGRVRPTELCYEGVHNKIDMIDLAALPFDTPGLDSGFRRRDDFKAPFLFVIPAPIFIGIDSSRSPVVLKKSLMLIE